MFQERTLSDVAEDDNLVDDDISAPFPFVTSASSGPAPVIYSVAQSKVVVYKPEKTTSTTKTPPTTSSTTQTTSASTTTTVKPFHYQLPSTEPVVQNVQTIPRNNIKKRPILYAKRRPGGKTSVSKPFEYLSRLSQFFSDRVLTGRTQNRQRLVGKLPKPLNYRNPLNS